MREMSILKKVCLGAAICALMFSFAACAPGASAGGGDTQEEETTTGAAPAKLPVWTVKSDCAKCHPNESSNDASHPYAIHAAKGLKCMDCHTDADGALTVAHKNYATAKSPTALSSTKVDTALCKTCHKAEDLKNTTAGSTVLTDASGKVVNPHDLPAVEGHADTTCTNCHSMHKAQGSAKDVCLSCHHTDEFVCKTCHE